MNELVRNIATGLIGFGVGTHVLIFIGRSIAKRRGRPDLDSAARDRARLVADIVAALPVHVYTASPAPADDHTYVSGFEKPDARDLYTVSRLDPAVPTIHEIQILDFASMREDATPTAALAGQFKFTDACELAGELTDLDEALDGLIEWFNGMGYNDANARGSDDRERADNLLKATVWKRAAERVAKIKAERKA